MERLADFLNEEPIAFLNCKQSEIKYSALIAVVVSLPFGVLAALCFTQALFGVLVAVLMMMVMTWLCMRYFSAIRDKHHEYWLPEQVFLFKHFIQGLWDPSVKMTLLAGSRRYRRGQR